MHRKFKILGKSVFPHAPYPAKTERSAARLSAVSIGAGALPAAKATAAAVRSR